MALINCPECNKEISDKATVCIGCGCPIGKPKLSASRLGEPCRCSKCGAMYPETDSRCPNCNSSIKEYKDTSSAIIANVQKASTRPKCPTCGSENIVKLNVADRVISIFFVGLASNKIGKQFRCSACGYNW